MKHSAYALVAFLILSVIIVVLKPMAPYNVRWQSFMNASALFVIFASISIVLDLTVAAFKLKPPIVGKR